MGGLSRLREVPGSSLAAVDDEAEHAVAPTGAAEMTLGDGVDVAPAPDGSPGATIERAGDCTLSVAAAARCRSAL